MEQFKLATRETPVTEDLGEIKKIAEELLSSATTAENADESKKYLGDHDQVVEYYKAVSCKRTYDAARASAGRPPVPRPARRSPPMRTNGVSAEAPEEASASTVRARIEAP